MKSSLRSTLACAVLAAVTGAAQAQPQNLTVISFGGATKAAQEQAYFKPFDASGAGNVVAGEYNGEMAKVKAMVGFPIGEGSEFNFDLRYYQHKDVAHLVGDYQTIRMSFRDKGHLNCYITSISWNDDLSCLCFEEKNNELAPYNTGYVSVPLYNRVIYLLTTQAGNFRLATLSDAYEKGTYYGGILTVGAEQMAFKGPIAATLVLKKLDCEEDGVHGVIGPEHSKFSGFLELMDFARKEGFFRVFS